MKIGGSISQRGFALCLDDEEANQSNIALASPFGTTRPG
jgi:hypothetical protein